MRLKTKYIAFVIAIHLLCLVMSYLIFEGHKIFFILAEAVIIASIIISLRLYQQLIRPLVYLKQGVNAIQDQDFSVKFLATGQKEVDELVAVYNRMIDELRAERTKQQEQHFFLEKLIQTSPTGIIVLDYDRQVKQINPKAIAILDAHPDLLTTIHAMKIGIAKTIKVDGLRTYKAQKSKFIDRGFERIFIMVEEVTAEIFEAEKNVYSKVIRMMAHEVNNTVGPVNSIIHSALRDDALWIDENNEALRNALKVAMQRNQNLNIFMRNFADLVKLPIAHKNQIDLVTVIKSVSELMQFTAVEKQIKLEAQLPEQPFFIFADASQLEPAFINIVKNSIEAIDTDGVIIIALNADKKTLCFLDNGRGIAKSDSEQLFSPFFSTKKDGQGIGLTLVREILLNHGFEFSLKTSQGFTQFEITL